MPLISSKIRINSLFLLPRLLLNLDYIKPVRSSLASGVKY
jgi:hypothetical protein